MDIKKYIKWIDQVIPTLEKGEIPTDYFDTIEKLKD